MRLMRSMRLVRGGGVLLLSTGLAALGAVLLLPAATGAVPKTPGTASGFEGQLVRACALAALGCLVWGWLATTVTVTEALVLAGRVPERRAGLPGGLRRLILAACGVALVGASPALAAGGSDATHQATSVAGLPFPSRAMDLPVVARHTVVVREGDSLWAISARHLPPDSSDAAVTDGWQRIYARNRDVVGDDPSLIRPGQRLTLPTSLEEQP